MFISYNIKVFNRMKKLFSILLLAVITVSFSAAGRSNSHSRLQNKNRIVTSASQKKADDVVAAISRDYSTGKISADSVVSLALYHKTWSADIAERCLNLAAADGNVRAMTELGVLYAFSPEYANRSADGVKLLQVAAQTGDDEAKAYLGYYYFNKKDYKQAKACFDAIKHMNQGIEYAALGSMYLEGKGVPEDGVKARDNYLRSSLTGLPRGMALYASLLGTENGGSLNYPDAFFWHYIAGELGDNYSRVMLYRPRVPEAEAVGEVGKDARTALQWIEVVHTGKSMKNEPLYKDGFLKGLKTREQAAEQGDDWSRFYLGSMNYHGDFLNKNYAQALRYYEPISRNGKLPRRMLAIVNERLSEMYRDGKGTRADKEKAARYTRKAASYGSLASYKTVENIPE